MVRPLREALQDPQLLNDLLHHPHTFRFPEMVSMVVAVEHYPPFLYVQTSGAGAGNITIRGPLANMLQLLATALNFTYRTVVPPDRVWGNQLADGSWTGLIGLLDRKEVHLAWTLFSVTEEREKAMDLSTTITMNSARMLTRNGSPQIDPWGFLLPLQPMVWAGLFLALVTAWLATVVLGWSHRKVARRPHTLAGVMFFQHLRALLHQGLTIQVRCGYEQLLLGTWMVVSMVVTWSYSGHLMSQLAVRHVPQPLQTLRHVLDHPAITLTLEPNTAYTELLAAEEKGTLRELRDLEARGRLKKHSIILDEVWAVRQLAKGDQVFVLDHFSADNFISRYYTHTGRCDLYMGREAFLLTPFSLGFQKGSPLLPAFNERLRRILSFGLLQQWLQSGRNINVSICRSASATLTVREQLSLNSLWGMFVVLGVGHLLALVSLCAEMMHSLSTTSQPVKGRAP